MPNNKPIRRIAIVGTGVIGARMNFYTSIGRKTVRINKEMPGHIANRLQRAPQFLRR